MQWLSHGNNEGGNCEALDRVLIKSSERQLQNKSRPSHSTGSKRSREQMKELRKNQKNKKLIKTISKDSKELAKEWNQL